MFVAQAIGSIFNIKYNLVHISPLLTGDQEKAFTKSIGIFNALAYPVLLVVWTVFVFRLNRIRNTPEDIHKQQCRVINLPVHAAILAGLGWVLCIPALFVGLKISGEKLDPKIYFHFPVSVTIAMVISLAIGYFTIDWLRQKFLFPHFFPDISPSRIKGGCGLTVSGRGTVWTFAASICPIIALLLLLLSPSEDSKNLWFAVSVAATGIASALISSILMGRLIVKPIHDLRDAAQKVGRGDLDVEINNLRADEFGILADEFNSMVTGLKEKERISNTFGRHVGKQIAEELLQSDHNVEEGIEREISILFADIRGFTTQCESLIPKEAVLFLNTYHQHMIERIEAERGIVNQLIGDGIMAMFGATGRTPLHADRAVRAGISMIQGLDSLGEKLHALGFDPVKIGVGINTGTTIVGTIGAPGRMEYTAIGDPVNTAARIEGMTKDVGVPMLISESTWERCESPKPKAKKLPPRQVRGRQKEIVLYSVDTSFSVGKE